MMKVKALRSLKQSSVYALCAIMLLNTNAWSIDYLATALFGGMAVASEKESDDELLKRLRQRHRLDDPYRHNRGQQRYEVINRSSNDLTDDLERSIISGRTRDSQLDFSRFNLESLSINDGLESAQAVAATASGPSLSADNEVEISVASEPVLEMYRDEETGELRYRQRENAHQIQRQRVRVGQSEIFSTEIEHEDTAWEGEGTYGDEQAFFQAGRDSNQRLRSNTTHTGESQAFKTIMASADRGANESVPDAILQPGYDYINEVTQPGGDLFTGCTTVTQTQNVGLYKPDIRERYCQEMNSDNPFFCEIAREFEELTNEKEILCRGTWGPSFPYSTDDGDAYLCNGGFVLVSEIEHYLETGLWESYGFVGPIGNPTAHKYIEKETEIITSVTQYPEGCLDNAKYIGEGSGSGGACNAQCEPSLTTPSDDPDLRYTCARPLLKQEGNQCHYGIDAENRCNSPITLQIQDCGEPQCELYCPLTANFQVHDPYGPGSGSGMQDCYGTLVEDEPENGVCGYELAGALICETQFDQMEPATRCTSGPGQDLDFPDNDGWCTFTDYEVIEKGSRGLTPSELNQIPPLFPGDTNKVSWRANLTNYTCDPFQGDAFCVEVEQEDGTLGEVCQTWSDIREGGGTCDIYESDPKCSEVARECESEGWLFHEWDNYCFNETVTYECDEGENVSFSFETDKNTCSNMLPCAGGECDWGDEEGNDRFLEAVAMGNVAEHIQGNQSCDNPNDPTTCRIFEGERGYCSWALASDWGQNCCDAPGGIDFLTYLNASMQLMRFTNKQLGGVFFEQDQTLLSGTWNTLSEVTSNAWSKLTGSTTAVAETTVGNASSTVVQAGVEESLAEAGMGKIATAISQFIYDSLPEAFGDLLFNTTTNAVTGEVTVQGLSEGMQAAADFMSSVMFWYSMYQLAQLVTDLYWSCDDTDNETSLKMAMRQCYPVGEKYCSKEIDLLLETICTQRRQDHCCYPSMLARIIMEQAHVILNKDMSECHGLDHHELSTLDFSQIDFSEWIGTLAQNDMLPRNTEEALTGSGRMINHEGRETVSERTRSRTEGMADSRDVIEQELREPLDCSKYPRPPVCDFGFSINN